MNYTGLKAEVNRMTGQRTGWVGDKQPMSYTPSREHWRTPKSLLRRLFRKGRTK